MVSKNCQKQMTEYKKHLEAITVDYKTATIVLGVVLVIVIIVSAIVIRMLLWRIRTLTGTFRCNKCECLPVRNANDIGVTTSPIELENPEQCYNTARRLESNEHTYTALQEQDGTSKMLPTPQEKTYSLGRNIPEGVTNKKSSARESSSGSEYSLAKVVSEESEKQNEVSVVCSLAKHPHSISGGATSKYFILEKESDSTPACKESESNQEYFILEKDSGPRSDED